MWDKEQQETWEEIKAMWKASGHQKRIHMNMSQLVLELKDKASEFEKNAIKRDLQRIKGSVSQFEKDAIKSDIQLITSAVKKFIRALKGKRKE